MGKIIDIIEALICLSGAIYFFLYYTGRLNYTGDNEMRRQKKIKKYGWLFIIVIGVLLSCSLGLFMIALS